MTTMLPLVQIQFCSEYTLKGTIEILVSLETYQPLTVEQSCVAAISDGPITEVEHMVNLLSQLCGILVLSHKFHSPLFGYTLKRKLHDFD